MSIFGNIEYNPDYEAWLGKIKLRGFQACKLRWNCNLEPFTISEQTRNLESNFVILDLQINSIQGESPSVEQEAAFQYLCSNELAVTQAVLKYAYKQCKSTYYPESLPEPKTLESKKLKIRKRLNTLDGFSELIEPNTLTILKESKRKTSYLAFDFRTSLDLEHGFSILIYRSKALNWAGAGELGGGPPETITPDDQELIWKSINSETLFFELVSEVIDIESAKNQADRILETENQSSDLYNRSNPLFTPNAAHTKQRSQIIGKRLAEFRRIWEECPDAAQYLDKYIGQCPAWKHSKP